MPNMTLSAYIFYSTAVVGVGGEQVSIGELSSVGEFRAVEIRARVDLWIFI